MTAPAADLSQLARDAAVSAGVDPADLDLAAASEIRFSDGRVFRISEQTTSRQDMWIMTRLNRAGLEAIAGTVNTHEKLDELAVQLVQAAYTNGTLYEILGGILTEDGVKWSQDSAARNAEYFADLTDPADKAAIQGPMVSLLLMYFTTGLASEATSQSSTPSAAVGSAASPSDQSATPSPASSSPSGSETSVPPDVLAHLHAEGSTLVSGMSSSTSSPSTTPTASTASSTGRSGRRSSRTSP